MRRDRGSTLIGLGDPVLLGSGLILAALGIGMIWSAGQVDLPSLVTGAWIRQLVWLCLSLLAFAIVIRVPMRWLEWATPWVYAFSIILLLAVLAVGSGPNTRSWLRIAGFSFQPAELAKLATILLLARLLGSRKEPQTRLFDLWKPVLAVVAPFILVMAQPDLGSAHLHAGQSWSEPRPRLFGRRVGRLVRDRDGGALPAWPIHG
jgi:cell division protein FtsW (lipid II flippase)